MTLKYVTREAFLRISIFMFLLDSYKKQPSGRRKPAHGCNFVTTMPAYQALKTNSPHRYLVRLSISSVS